MIQGAKGLPDPLTWASFAVPSLPYTQEVTRQQEHSVAWIVKGTSEATEYPRRKGIAPGASGVTDHRQGGRSPRQCQLPKEFAGVIETHDPRHHQPGLLPPVAATDCQTPAWIGGKVDPQGPVGMGVGQATHEVRPG